MNEPGLLVRVALGIGLAKRTVPAARLHSVNDAPADAAASPPMKRPQAISTSQAPHMPPSAQAAERTQSSGSAPRSERLAASRPAQAASNAAPKPQQSLGDGLPTRGKSTDIGTVMPAAAQLNGDLEIEESIVLQCVVRGNVTQTGDHQVVLTATGGIHGVLRAHTAVIGGTVEGDVYADRVVLLETGLVHGNIEYSTIAIKEGATVNGILMRVVPNVVGTGERDAQEEAGRSDPPGLRAVGASVDARERAA
ncbi:bactofilin family protein [Trinickia diaoshuihuensis]|uniref:bactofilin family protein n=1 Tax=Trinickia diaoshuihuensis TaxID=2292265 RepID=UPI0013C2AFEC|nr:polymer-forming cytoskeletal protein [Trinickia diaoshuihuensis]